MIEIKDEDGDFEKTTISVIRKVRRLLGEYIKYGESPSSAIFRLMQQAGVIHKGAKLYGGKK